MIRMGRNTNTKPESPQQPETNTSPVDANKMNHNFGFQPQTTEPPPPQNRSSNNDMSAASNRAFTESESMARDIKEGRLSGFVGSGTTLSGETEFKAMLRVDGHLVGKVSSEAGTLIVGSGGQVDADVRVAAAVINGTVNGDIMASERLELGRTAKVIGNIQAPSLMIEQGAIFEGSCSMMKSKADFDKRSAHTVVDSTKQQNNNKDVKEPFVAAKAEPSIPAKTENGAVVTTN